MHASGHNLQFHHCMQGGHADQLMPTLYSCCLHESCHHSMQRHADQLMQTLYKCCLHKLMLLDDSQFPAKSVNLPCQTTEDK